MHLVGIGASAGGLEALQALLGNLQPGGTVAYAVAQHLSPDHRSHLVDLLSRCTAPEVQEAVDGALLRPGCVNIGPPGKDLTVQGHQLVVSAPEPRFGPSPSVDRLFESMAQHWQERGAAVVLSGTGSDGARGLRAVRAAGGLTIAQAPESARFGGMPSAAIALGGAELILEPAAIGQRLGELLTAATENLESRPTGAAPDPVNIFSLMGQLKRITGIDFSQYKAVTVRRQLQRRMLIRQQRSVDDYIQLLESDGKESFALVKNLLVSVTSFFRDPQMFAALGEHLRGYLDSGAGTVQLRVWVPGCATGEEAYSLGMLISELLNHPPDLSNHLKIFATDLDEESLAVGRRASYPGADAMAIPESLRERFVSHLNGDLEISDSLRRCVVFARHNIAEDPPFPRLDLISCRNTLIYFNPPLQERALSLFHAGLLPGGLLFLGPSESPSSRTTGFSVVDAVSHIFRRTPDYPSPGPIHRSLASQPPSPLIAAAGRMPVLHDTLPEQHIATLEALVRTSCPTSVILDEHHELVEVIGDVSPFCRLPEGRISNAAIAFLQPELQAEARALLLLVRADGVPIRSRPIRMKGHDRPLRLEVRPLLVTDRTLTVLTFLPVSEHPAEDGAGDEVLERNADLDREIARLESDLLKSQESQRISLAELEAANQELEASAEELQAFSEELQSANEELQATNLELVSLNHQLQGRSDQLQALTDDLENIQNSLTQGMVVVDRNLRITRYTPLAVRVFGLVVDDIGQPLLGLPTTLPLPGLSTALAEVLAGAARRCIEAVSEDAAFLVQVLPYQEKDGQQRGAIISLTDVSELEGLRHAAEASLGDFSMLADALDQAVWKRDAHLHRLLYASLRFLPLTGWSPGELFAHPELLDEAIDPEDRERVWASRDLRQSGWTVTYRILTREGHRRWVQETARVVADNRDRSVVGTLTDVTGLRESQERAHHLAQLFEALLSSPSFALAVLDANRQVVQVNDALCRLLGFERESLLGSPVSLICALPSLPEPMPGSDPARPSPALHATIPLLHRDGHPLALASQLWRVPSSSGPGDLLLVIPVSPPLVDRGEGPSQS
ncbi:PAS domain S-box protein [Cyanobium sp. AMD-g]|nr:PAS domain S-box protein [Cyanobium sp. AMD-g]